MSLSTERLAMAQAIHDSFWAMEAGEFPDPARRQEPNAGDMQLASDLQEAGYALAPTDPLLTHIADLVRGPKTPESALATIADIRRVLAEACIE